MAKIFVVDDNRDVRDSLRMLLEGEGHEVVLEAGTLQGAREQIAKAQELGVAVAILDGSLSRGGNEGEVIARELQKQDSSIKILSLSGEKRTWGDLNLTKDATPEEVASALHKLLSQSQN